MVSFFSLLYLAFKVGVIIVVVGQAKKLEREPVSWGIFAFIFPIISLIAVFLSKPKRISPESGYDSEIQQQSETGFWEELKESEEQQN